MSQPECGILHCKSNAPRVSIPIEKLDPIRRKTWLQYCSAGTEKLTRGFVCIRHFSAAQKVDVGGKSLLRRDAIPDQHLPRYVLLCL